LQIWTVHTLGKLIKHNSSNYFPKIGTDTKKHLFPGKNEMVVSKSEVNFWSVMEKGSWLNPLTKFDVPKTYPEEESPTKKAYYKYFENMSRAMAESCSGRVFVMTDRPDELDSYAYIWYIEWLALFEKYRHGVGQSKVTKLYAVGVSDKSIIEMDFAKRTPLPQQPSISGNIKDPENYPEKRQAANEINDWNGTLVGTEIDPITLGLRMENPVDEDQCLGNIVDEPEGEDWFG
jgi:hypothetical protein